MRGVGGLPLAPVLGIEHEIVIDLAVNILTFGIPIEAVGNGFQVDGHGLEFGAPVFGYGLMASAAVMEDESELAALLFEDVFFDRIKIKASGQLDIVCFGHGFLRKSPAIEKHPGAFVKA